MAGRTTGTAESVECRASWHMAIAAVILGGTSLFGGKGTILGTFAGSLLIGTINNGLIIMGLDVSEQMMIAGAIIIVAVAFGKKPGQA